MSLKALERSFDSNYYSDEFIKFIEDNLGYFNKPSDLTKLDFDPARGYVYEGDFYGLLTYLNVEQNVHYLTLRLNGYDHPGEFAADRTSINVYTGGLDAAIVRALTTKTR